MFWGLESTADEQMTTKVRQMSFIFGNFWKLTKLKIDFFYLTFPFSNIFINVFLAFLSKSFLHEDIFKEIFYLGFFNVSNYLFDVQITFIKVSTIYNQSKKLFYTIRFQIIYCLNVSDIQVISWSFMRSQHLVTHFINWMYAIFKRRGYCVQIRRLGLP